MTTTLVRTKEAKKQPAFTPSPSLNSTTVSQLDNEYTRKLEQAVMDLEDSVYKVLNSEAEPDTFQDVDYLYWSRQLKNIAAQLSLALGEYGGLKRFHYHYKHDPEDEEALLPVAGPEPLLTLVRVCREALTQCSELVGLQNAEILRLRGKLEQAIRQFLHRWQYMISTNH